MKLIEATRYWKCVLMSAVLIVAMMFSGVSPVFAEICTENDLADAPLELLGGKGPPPLFMIIFNNTDSMDYEIMTGGSANGQLPNPNGGDPIGWVYNTPPLNNNSPAIENAAYYGAWKGMCYTYNKLFYNPNIIYNPWPHWVDAANAPAGSIDQPSGRQPDPPDATTNGANAKVNAPRPEPMDNASTYDLTANFGAGFPTIAYEDILPLHAAVNQEVAPAVLVDGELWGEVATFTSVGTTARIEVTHTVTSVNSGAVSNEFYAGPLKFWYQAGKPAPVFQPTSRTPVNGWIQQNGSNFTGYLTDQVGDFTATWNASGLVDGKSYKVYAKWTALNERSNSVQYRAKRAIAGPPITVKRRHFYLVSSNGFPYLVNLIDASTATFYKLDETLGAIPDKVEGQELILTTWANLPADIRAIIPAPAVNAYSALLQNFANWFSFFRTRGFAAKNAIGVTIDEMSYVMIGLMTVPPTNARECRWVDTDFNGIHYDKSLDLMNFTYMLPDPGGNPNYADAIMNAGTYFQGGAGAIPSQSTTFQNSLVAAGYTNTATTYPYFLETYGGACQHAFALMISDGSASGSSNIPNYDGNNGYPFADTFEDTMADGAMYYYENDLHPNDTTGDLADHVPTNYIDLANWQHMVTYGITFGVDGDIRQQYPDCDALCTVAGCCPASWPDPWASRDANLLAKAGLDDLYHATVNSRGIYLYASNPQELVEQMRLIKSDIERRMGAAAAVTTNSVQRQIGATVYQGLYHSGTWWGDLLARTIDVNTGSIDVTVWSAQTQLEAVNYDQRHIFTSSGGAAYDFSYGVVAGNFGLTEDELNYIRGQRTNEGLAAPAFRPREYKLGDIVHSEPFFYKDVVYVGANDGMMHAFDAANGNELFAYVPSMVHSKLKALTLHNFIDDHQYYIDGSPHVKSFISGAGVTTTYLAGGLGKGAKGVYCLTVDNAKNSPTAANTFKWEYSDPTDTNLGYVYGRAYLVESTVGPVVIFSNGYASDSQHAVLYVRKASDGTEVHTFDTGYVGSGPNQCNGLSSPALTDYNYDGVVDYVYAGDLDGNLWKFNLTNANPNLWSISYGGSPLFTARDDDGAGNVKVQPITSEPDVMPHCDGSRKGFIVVFGTGQYLNEDDLLVNVAHQAFYGIYDWEADFEAAGQVPPVLGAFEFGGALSNVAQTLLHQEYLTSVDNFGATTNYVIDYYNPLLPGGTGTNAGWYFLLPESSERMVRDPIIRDDVVIFVTNTISSGMCSGVGGSYVNALDACSGARPDKPQFDTNNDRKVDGTDLITVSGTEIITSREYYSTTLFDPKAFTDLLYINDTFGNIIEHPLSPNPPGLRFWQINE